MTHIEATDGTAGDDHVYLSLAQMHDDGDARWAFGTGFADPLHGVDTAVPEGVDAAVLAATCLALGDDALVSAQRLAEWCTRAPELEEEVALANIGLDLIGQARLLYARCGQVDGSGRGEDAYAYFRDASGFKNVALAELPNGDFAFSVTRLLLLSAWRLAQATQLAASPDPVLAAVAAKAVPELTYHRQYAADWVVRLGDGTQESHRRMCAALEDVAPYVAELFTPPAAAPWGDESGTAGTDTDTGPTLGAGTGSQGAVTVREEVANVLNQVLAAAGLALPEGEPAPYRGRSGEHTEHLGPLLAELQSVARTHPEATW